MLDKFLKPVVHKLLSPVSLLLIKIGISPDLLTLIGLFMNLLATVAFSRGLLRVGATIMLTAGIFDILDGQVARQGKKESKFGALLDSTTDRYSEIFIYFGICAFFVSIEKWIPLVVLFFSLCGSLMVSYVRARAESLGEECKVGTMQRPERIILLAIGAMFGYHSLVFALVVLAVTTNYTVLERLSYIKTKLSSNR